MKPIEDFLHKDVLWYHSKHAEKMLLIFADIFALAIAFCLAQIYILQMHQNFQIWWTEHAYKHLIIYASLLFVAVVWFGFEGHYSKRSPYYDKIRLIIKICFVMALADAAFMFFDKSYFSRIVLLLNWILAPCLLLLMRSAVRIFLIHIGGWTRPFVIIGSGENAMETARAFNAESSMGYHLVAFLIPNEKNATALNYKDQFGNTIPCIHLGQNAEHILQNFEDIHVVVAMEQDAIDEFQLMTKQASRLCRNVQIVPSLRGLPLYGMQVNHFFRHEVLLLTIRNNLGQRGKRVLKRSFDIFASSSALIIGLPVFLLVGLGVAASGRPIFFGHKRVGQYKRSFLCYKFRTMLPDSEKILLELLARDPEAKADWARDFKLKNDPRVTPFGQFLRKTSLDELPQFWNVLRGDMSLVGPRPIVEAELERYGAQVDYYLETKPGITGLWQISGRNDIDYDTRVNLDAWYVKNWSLINDIGILIETVKVILKKDGAY